MPTYACYMDGKKKLYPFSRIKDYPQWGNPTYMLKVVTGLAFQGGPFEYKVFDVHHDEGVWTGLMEMGGRQYKLKMVDVDMNPSAAI